MTHRNHGSRNEFLYKTPLIMVYYLALILIAHAFFVFADRVPSARYWIMLCSLASHDPLILFTTRWESTLATRMSLAPDPSRHDDPSVNRVHGFGVTSSAGASIGGPSSSGLSAIKIAIIMEYLVNISKRRAFWSLNEDILKIYDSDYQYAVSIKEDKAYLCLHSPKTMKETRSIRRIQKRPIRRIEDIVCEDSGRYQAMTKVIKGEFKKLKDLKVEDVSLTCDTSLEVFNNEFNRLSKLDDDLFTYKVEVYNISCDSNMDGDSEHEADDDMGYDPSDVSFTEWLGSKFFNYKTRNHYTMKALWIYWIRGNDEVELTDLESSKK
ncbi:hypothetical protein Tco_0266892 [Tanacetum coccineum]